MLNFEWTMNVSFPLSLVLSHLPFPPFGSFLPLDTDMQRAGRFNEPEMTWHRHIGNLLSEVRCSTTLTFSVCTADSNSRSWFSFFPISPARRHHAVTDDISPYRDGFFAADVSRAWRHRPSGCVRALRKCLLSSRVRYHYLRNMNDKKSRIPYNNILVTRNRCRMT